MTTTSPIRYIRTVVFGLTQVEFAKIVKRTQVEISNWERGAGRGPRLEELRRIRAAAKRRRLKRWRDDLFFRKFRSS